MLNSRWQGPSVAVPRASPMEYLEKLSTLSLSGADVDKILAVIAVLSIAALLYTIRKFSYTNKKYRKPREATNYRTSKYPLLARSQSNVTTFTPNIADPAQQMHAISFVEFEIQRLLNREEVPILYLLEKLSRELNCGLRVMAQTSLGEIIRPKRESGTTDQCDLAYRAINSKRVDFAVFDKSGRVILVVEYQGSGHYRQTSFMRDAVKREALRKAGVAFIEIPNRYDWDQVAASVRGALLQKLHFKRVDVGGVEPGRATPYGARPAWPPPSNQSRTP